MSFKDTPNSESSEIFNEKASPAAEAQFDSLHDRLRAWDRAQEQSETHRNLVGALLDMFEQEGKTIPPQALRKAFGLETSGDKPERAVMEHEQTEELDLEELSPGYESLNMSQEQYYEEDMSDTDFVESDPEAFDFEPASSESPEAFDFEPASSEEMDLASDHAERHFEKIKASVMERGLTLEDYEDFKRIWNDDGRSLNLKVAEGKVSFTDFEPETLRLAKELLDAEVALEADQKGMLLAESGVKYALSREIRKLRSTELPEEWRSTKKERAWLLSRNLFMIAAVALVGMTTLSLAANAVGNLTQGVGSATSEVAGELSVTEFIPLIATAVVVWAMLKKSESLGQISNKIYGWFNTDSVEIDE